MSQKLQQKYLQKLREFKALKLESKTVEDKLQEANLNVATCQRINSNLNTQIVLLDAESKGLDRQSMIKAIGRGLQSQQESIITLNNKKQELQAAGLRRTTQNQVVIQRLKITLDEKYNQQKSRAKSPENSGYSMMNSKLPSLKQELEAVLSSILKQKTLQQESGKSFEAEITAVESQHSRKIQAFQKQLRDLQSDIQTRSTHIQNQRRDHQKELGTLKAEMFSQTDLRKETQSYDQSAMQLDRQMLIVTEKLKAFTEKKKDFAQQKVQLREQRSLIAEERSLFCIQNQQARKSSILQSIDSTQSRISSLQETHACLLSQLQSLSESRKSLRTQILVQQNREYARLIRMPSNSEKEEQLRLAIAQVLKQLIDISLQTEGYQSLKAQEALLKANNAKLQLRYKDMVEQYEGMDNQFSQKCSNYSETLRILKNQYNESCFRLESKKKLVSQMSKVEASCTKQQTRVSRFLKTIYYGQFYLLITLAAIGGMLLIQII